MINNYINPYQRVKISSKVGIEIVQDVSVQGASSDFDTDIKEITI